MRDRNIKILLVTPYTITPIQKEKLGWIFGDYELFDVWEQVTLAASIDKDAISGIINHALLECDIVCYTNDSEKDATAKTIKDEVINFSINNNMPALYLNS